MNDNTAVKASKHPRGLPFLFFTEMWERFGYYLMLGIFVLYIVDPNHGLAIVEKMNAHNLQLKQ
ncbi:MAG: hypothetical protein EOP49_13880 [Sphingobacteriales bacterium]|nr:MAG: hypothetical protein EOP49_13880 [Sphingobacteriales bacterium]